MVQYGDPFPANWPRVFRFCEQARVQIPRVNSTIVDTFSLEDGEATALLTSAVTPLVSAVQNPTINGANLFQTTTLNSGVVTLSWSAPAIGQPFAYTVTPLTLTALPMGFTAYSELGNFMTAKTSMTLPTLLQAGQTYLFLITASVDGHANAETSPNRSALPTGYARVISAPITIGQK